MFRIYLITDVVFVVVVVVVVTVVVVAPPAASTVANLPSANQRNGDSF